MMSYDANGINENGSKSDLSMGLQLWIDMVDPSPDDLAKIQKEYDLNEDAINLVKQKTKRPQVRMLDNHVFTIVLDIQYKTQQHLLIDGIYLFTGRDWLITIHSSDIDLVGPIKHLLEKKNRKLIESGINALYYTIISETIGKYEYLLTSIELTITDFEQKSLHKKSSKAMLNYLDMVTRQIILLRRHFWYTRDIMNFLTHIQQQHEQQKDEDDKNEKEIKYLQIAYDDINQLIELVESYQDTINSTRDLYLANVSLQLNDTMRILTIFSVILLPLTLIAGIYGMNGLDLTKIGDIPQGFVIVIITMVLVIILLLVFFRYKRWILVKEEEEQEHKDTK